MSTFLGILAFMVVAIGIIFLILRVIPFPNDGFFGGGGGGSSGGDGGGDGCGGDGGGC
jgi:hypothetical protein